MKTYMQSRWTQTRKLKGVPEQVPGVREQMNKELENGTDHTDTDIQN